MPALSSLSRARVPVAGLVRSVGARVPPPSVARLRAAVTALFVLDGAVFGSWAARVPDVAARVGAGHSTLGIALLCLSLGALVCMRFTGALVRPVRRRAGERRRRGRGLGDRRSCRGSCTRSRRCASRCSSSAPRPAWSTSRPTPSACRWRPASAGRSCPGCTPGSASAASPARCSAAPPPSVLGVGAHLALVAAAGLFVSAWALPALLGAGRGAAAPQRAAARGEATRRPTAVLVVLGAIAGCTAFGEGALTDWGALLLREHLGAPATVAAAGYAGFSLAMASGRLVGGRLLHALGERRLLVGGAVLAAAGAVAAVTTSSLAVALGRLRARRPRAWPTSSRWRSRRAGLLGGARGIALATTVGYTGLLGGPPAIGLLAEVRRAARRARLGGGAGGRRRRPGAHRVRRAGADAAAAHPARPGRRDRRRAAPARGVRLRPRHRRLRA